MATRRRYSSQRDFHISPNCRHYLFTRASSLFAIAGFLEILSPAPGLFLFDGAII